MSEGLAEDIVSVRKGSLRVAEGEAGFHAKKHAWQSGVKRSGGKSVLASSATPPAQPPTQRCPSCASKRIWKDGLRQTRNGDVQRYICRDCGYRFSQNWKGSDPPEHVQKIQRIAFYSHPTISSNRQVCVAETQGAKNLAEVETRTQKRAAGATTKPNETIKGLIVEYMYWLDKEGYKTTGYPKLIKRLASCGANLLDPEDVKKVIAKMPWKDSVRMLACYAYDIFVREILKDKWEMPKYKQQETLPFVPDEKELDQLIAACKSRRMAAFLQTLKETFADPGEVLRLKWKDISGNIITINAPVKGHNPGQIQVSNKLIAMLNALPKTSPRVFPCTYNSLYGCFVNLRKRAAHVLQNPRLLEITFTTFRHWGGTMIAHYTNGNVLKVQKLLRHKSITSTMKYIHMIKFEDNEFEVTTATTIEEAKDVLAIGFDYVTEKNGIMLFRRPKRFSNI